MTARRVLGAFVSVLAAVGLLVLEAPPASACRCAVGALRARLQAADAVFVGHATGVESDGVDDVYEFAVDGVYKGRVTERQQIVADAHTSCATRFAHGARYLVFASRPSLPGGDLEPGQYGTHLCSGSVRVRGRPPAIGRDPHPPVGAIEAVPPVDPPDDPPSMAPIVAVAGGVVLVALAVGGVVRGGRS